MLLSDLVRGVRCLLEGAAIVIRSPRLLLLGALPAVLTTLLLLGALIGLVFVADDLVAWATPFADDWPPGTRSLLRVALGVALVAGCAVLAGCAGWAVMLFAALTLLIGGPLYERFGERVDEALGPVDRVEEPALRQFFRGLKESGLFMLLSVARTVPLFLVGFIPLLGQTVVPVAAVLVGGWMVTVELIGVPFQARGRTLDDRLRALRSRPMLTLAFGVPVYLLCLVPLVAIVALPLSVAGAVVLARELDAGSGGGSGGAPRPETAP